MDELRSECLSQIFDEIGISATDEQIEKVSNDFASHLDMEYEMSSHQFIGGNNDECQDCKKLKLELSEKAEKITIFTNSIKERRGANDVWIEGNDVMYY